MQSSVFIVLLCVWWKKKICFVQQKFDHKHVSKKKQILTRMHSSQMHAVRCSRRLLGEGCLPAKGVYLPKLGVSPRGWLPARGCLPTRGSVYLGGLPARGRLPAWGVSACLERCLPAWGGVCLPGRGVHLPVWIDRHMWKHNLSTTTVVNGKKAMIIELHMVIINE